MWPCRTRAGASALIDMSTIAPMRKPSRMPFFTQAFTRHPVFGGRIRLGGANLAGVQRLLESLEEPEMFVGVGLLVFRRTAARSQPACTLRPASRPRASSTFSIFGVIRGAGRAQWAAATPAPAVPSAPWRPSPESDSIRRSSLPSAADIAAAVRARPRNRWPARAAMSSVISRGNFIRDHRNHAVAAERDQRNGDGRRRRDSTAKLDGT